MKKRILSILLVVCMVVTLLPSFTITAKAAGEGTGDPVNGAFVLDTSGVNIITNADQLAYVAQQINANVAGWISASYKLGNSIDLSAYPSFEPIGRYKLVKYSYEEGTYPFTGTFDGAGFAIKNLKVNTGAITLGFFGEVGIGGTVKNLALIDSIMPNGHNSGTIAGINKGTIQNCYSNGIIYKEGDWAQTVGGIVGRNYGIIENCYVSGSVNAGLGIAVGPIVGFAESTSIVRNCYYIYSWRDSDGLGAAQMQGSAGATDGSWTDITISGVNKGKISLVDALNQWVSAQSPGSFKPWYCSSADGNAYPGFVKEEFIVNISDGTGVGTSGTTAAASLAGAITSGTTCVAPGETVTITVGTPDSAYKVGSLSVYKTGSSATTVGTTPVSAGVYWFTMPRYPVTIAASYAPKSTGKGIGQFYFTNPASSGLVNNGDYTVKVTVPYGTNVSSLSPVITLSLDATINPKSGVAQDFTSDVIYTVTAENGDTRDWTVIVSVKGATPTGVGFDAVSSILTGISDGMEYSVNGGSTWVKITGSVSGKVAISGVTAAKGIRVRNNSAAPHTVPSDASIIDIAQAATPSAPTISAVTANSVTLTPVNGNEYSINGSTWQTSNLFDNLNPATVYTFYQRVAASGATLASIKSDGKAQYTAAAKPTTGVGYSINYATEKITVTGGYEVNTDAGFTSGTAIANDATLTAGKTYYVRMAATSSVPASEAISFTIPGRPAAPTTVITADKTRNSITIASVAGQEYKIEGRGWQDSGSFTGLSANTEYIVYARVKAVSSGSVSFASEAYSTTIKTKPDGSIGFALPTITVSPTYDPGKTLNDIPLPTDWAWSEPPTVPTVTISGYDAIYTPTDTDTVDYSGVNGYHVDGSGKVTITCTVPLAVNPATPKAADFTYTAPASLGYSGTAKTATVTPTVGINGMGVITVKYYDNNGAVVVAPTDAGTYTVKIDVGEGVNYTEASDITIDSPWTFTIDKAPITDCAVAQTGALTYNGSPQTAAVTTTCTTAGSQTATYTYCDTQDGIYSYEIPAHTDAGEYTVYYKVTAANHNDESGSFTVIIGSLDLSKLADADITVNPNTVVYTGEAWQPSVTVKSGSSTIPTENYTVSYSNNTNTGDVTVTVTAKGPNCTNAKSVTKSITQAELRAEMFSFSADSALTYDETAKPATVTAVESGTYAAPTGDIAIYYELKTGDSTYGSRVTTVPTSAGTYRVSIDVTDGGNYQGITNLTAAGWSFSITKAPISFDVSNDNYTFDANPHIATVAQTTQQTPTLADNQFAVTYKLPADGSGTADKTDVGIYDVIVTLSDDNFCFVSESDPTVRSRKVGELKINKSVVAALWKNTSAVYSGTVKSPEFALIGLKTADEGLVSAQLSGSAINAGTYIVTAELTGTKAGNYSLTNPVGAFVIQKAPVIFTLAGDSVKYDGNSHSVAATAEPNVSNVITYRNAKGEIIAAPAAAGSYDVYAEITNGNYRHADGADGSPRKIGVLTIYQNNAPATYTANFDANGGSGFTTALSAVQSGTVRILPVNNFSNTGKSFAGWQYSGKIYQPGESFAQPSANVTLKALWNDKAYAIGGTVQEGNPVSNASNVVVTLMLGSRQIGQTITDAEGKYNFLDVSPGVYNLVANKDGVTQTIMVILSDKNITDQDIVMPTGALNSVVEVKAGSPAIVIGNLDKAFTEQDEAEAQTQAVELKLTAETKALDTNDLPQQEIQKKSGNINLFLDMTLTKKIGNAEITLSNSPVLLSAVITLPAELQGKDSYTVYRYHGTEVQTLTTTQNAEGEKIEISKDKTTLTVYTKNFSVYAIKGTIYSGGGGSGGSVSGYKLSFEVNGGSSIAMLSGAPDATVDLSVYRPVREGYNFAGWYTDEKLTNSITSLKLTANTTVYAKWTEKGAMPFADVPVDSYYYDAVLWALDKRITSGANPVTFAPGGICTRAQAVTFLWRAMGSPESTRTNSPFADVKADAYCYKAVLWATENSITKGTSDSTFSPNRTVTRSQTMTFLWRTAGNPTLDGPNHFADVKAGAYYADAVLWAIEESITSGTSAETFSPLEDCSRAQIVTFLYRYMGK